MSEKIGQLKLKSQDGKYRETDVTDIEKNLGESVVTKTNKLNYKYIEENESRKKLKNK